MEEQKQQIYKLSLSTPDGAIAVNKDVSEEVAHKILLLLVPSTSTKLVDISIDSAGVPIGEQSPKEFLMEKKPSTDIERITCLAYYLTHNRNVREFKTEDLTGLNSEAQQIRFSNPSATARNAVKIGYLTLVGGGRKQITTVGEEIVKALPDHSKIKEVVKGLHPRRTRRKKNTREE
jgi:hypothetical protein